jgi:predicted DNA-binding transcriptional regulator AlpA
MTEVAILTKNDLEQIIHSTVSAAVLQIKPAHFPLIMTKKQVAEYLGKTPSTINRWMTEGLPFRKEGKEHPEFYKPEVDRWLSERFSEPQELRRIA